MDIYMPSQALVGMTAEILGAATSLLGYAAAWSPIMVPNVILFAPRTARVTENVILIARSANVKQSI